MNAETCLLGNSHCSNVAFGDFCVHCWRTEKADVANNKRNTHILCDCGWRLCLSNVGGRRDRHDIVAEILETARGGAIKTHVMYKAKLSYGQVSEYIPMLLEKGFLENVTVGMHRQVKHLLKTTELGEKFLENLRSVNLILSS